MDPLYNWLRWGAAVVVSGGGAGVVIGIVYGLIDNPAFAPFAAIVYGFMGAAVALAAFIGGSAVGAATLRRRGSRLATGVGAAAGAALTSFGLTTAHVVPVGLAVTVAGVLAFVTAWVAYAPLRRSCLGANKPA